MQEVERRRRPKPRRSQRHPHDSRPPGQARTHHRAPLITRTPSTPSGRPVRHPLTALLSPHQCRSRSRQGVVWSDAGKQPELRLQTPPIQPKFGCITAAHAVTRLPADSIQHPTGRKSTEYGVYTSLYVGRYEESVPFLQAVLAKDPGYQRTGFLLGFAHQRAGRKEEMFSTYRNYLERKPRDYQAHFNLAFALMNGDHCHKAIEEFKQTLILNPDYIEVHLHLSTCYKRLGKPEEAEKNLAIWNNRPK